MKTFKYLLRKYNTRHCTVSVYWCHDYDFDCSRDTSLFKKVEEGELTAMICRCSVKVLGVELGSDLAEGMIYANPEEFIRDKEDGRYAYMVRNAIAEARMNKQALNTINLRSFK